MASVSELRVYLRLFANDVISPYGAYDVIAERNISEHCWAQHVARFLSKKWGVHMTIVG